ncbi:hypothetical protein BT96DRAFT_989639 [Gymnopus androsaceus JB14]|uniref:Chondroitin AC/alginate lyase n=1 Tax=Gymnopus androsaceus JB14 TaxID=1447944 RepID=A0A6A4I058_9AGAR|nr:hypothetical protein BT96DRAFT_989639 [Gymnopus androsaceus JB14]
MHLRYLLPILFVAKPLAAEFATPSTWEGTNITASTLDRQATIAAAIDVVYANESSNDDFFSILAVYDFRSNTTAYEDAVTAHFSNSTFASNQFVSIALHCLIWTDPIVPTYVNSLMSQCVDAVRAYQAYQDSATLDLAVQAWEYGRTLTISKANIAAGSIPAKTFNITKTCSGVSLVGGTFWQTTDTDTTIFGDSTALFFALSAYLYQATSNSTYLDAAQDSGAFMVDLMNITSAGNGLATVSANDSASCGDTFGAGTFRIDQAGFFLEGLAILPGNTSFGKQDLSVDTLRSNLVNITLTTNKLANADNGIINVGSGLGDQSLVQGLGTLYHTINATGPGDLVTYIGNFLSVQYNTIFTAATILNSNIYAGSWIGPPVEQYDETNQTLALFALVNAAQVTLTTNSTTTGAATGTGTGAGAGNGSGTSTAVPQVTSTSNGAVGLGIDAVLGSVIPLVLISIAIL